MNIWNRIKYALFYSIGTYLIIVLIGLIVGAITGMEFTARSLLMAPLGGGYSLLMLLVAFVFGLYEGGNR